MKTSGSPWVWDPAIECYKLDESEPHLWTEGSGPAPFHAIPASPDVDDLLRDVFGDV